MGAVAWAAVTGPGALSAQEGGDPAARPPSEAMAEDDDREAVLETVRLVFRGIRLGDGALIRRVMHPDARLQGVDPDGDPRPPMDVEAFAASVEESTGRLVERMWNSEVQIQGPVAQIWAPYDFYRDGTFSHCGVDAVQLVKTPVGWQVVAITWTVEQPPACERHPDGPPPGAGR